MAKKSCASSCENTFLDKFTFRSQIVRHVCPLVVSCADT